jgi:hypothetical protein
MFSFIYHSPRNNNPSPKTNLNIFLSKFFFQKIIRKIQEKPINIIEIILVSNFNHIDHKITSDNGAHIFVHMITQTAFSKETNQAHTKANNIKETTPLLCKTAVEKAHVKIALRFVFV